MRFSVSFVVLRWCELTFILELLVDLLNCLVEISSARIQKFLLLTFKFLIVVCLQIIEIHLFIIVLTE